MPKLGAKNQGKKKNHSGNISKGVAKGSVGSPIIDGSMKPTFSSSGRSACEAALTMCLLKNEPKIQKKKNKN